MAGSYIDILKMDPLVFLTFLEQYKVKVNCNVESVDEMNRAGQQLGEIANAYSFLSSLYTYAGGPKASASAKRTTGRISGHDR